MHIFVYVSKKNEFIEVKNDIWVELNNLGLTQGYFLF